LAEDRSLCCSPKLEIEKLMIHRGGAEEFEIPNPVIKRCPYATAVAL
jgi:hypothetical protein